MVLKTLFQVTYCYSFLLLLVRLSKKRTIYEGTTLDFVVTLIIGDMIDDALWNEVSLSYFTVGTSVIFLLHIANKMGIYFFPTFSKLVQGTSSLLWDSNQWNCKNMRRERITKNNINAYLREENIQDINQVQQVRVEITSEFSSLLKSQEKEAQKKDWPTQSHQEVKLRKSQSRLN
jgi:uncharacterized membrane protein YcaP (DUF421 family)